QNVEENKTGNSHQDDQHDGHVGIASGWFRHVVRIHDRLPGDVLGRASFFITSRALARYEFRQWLNGAPLVDQGPNFSKTLSGLARAARLARGAVHGLNHEAER